MKSIKGFNDGNSRFSFTVLSKKPMIEVKNG